MNREELASVLSRYSAADAEESSFLVQLIRFVAETADPFSRGNLARGAGGHLTGSALLLSPNGDAMALLWHEKLQRWLQPGGHCEPDCDANLIETARRELIEESELPSNTLALLSPEPFDVDIHTIPARPGGSEPEHLHYDVRYLFQLTRPLDFPESVKARWVSLDDAKNLPDPSLTRMARKARRRLV
jgi:8-oxo-dGTP pyrophosphatase MutT (NUDIX family)